jgi:hypothetical protein
MGAVGATSGGGSQCRHQSVTCTELVGLLYRDDGQMSASRQSPHRGLRASQTRRP